MKKILALIGLIIALAVIVHAEADRKDTQHIQAGQDISRTQEMLTLMRDMVVMEERIVKGGNKKKMLADLAQMHQKLDRMIVEIETQKLGRSLTMSKAALAAGTPAPKPGVPAAAPPMQKPDNAPK